MRICSLLPAATEILCALGLQEAIVGISHECDYPPAIRGRPRLTRSRTTDFGESIGIDQQVRQSLALGEALYVLDEELLDSLRPDLVVTQSLCSVCAVGSEAASRALQRLSPKPQVVSLHPHSLDALFKEIRLLGRLTSRKAQAEVLVAALVKRIEAVQQAIAASGNPPRRVVCLEWLDPLMSAGHWVPEMVEVAGGCELLGRQGQPSRRVTADALLKADPEMLILMPCGFSIERTRSELPMLAQSAWWGKLTAVRQGNIRLVDGPAFFNRCGPRTITGIELLASLLHPQAGSIVGLPAL